MVSRGYFHSINSMRKADAVFIYFIFCSEGREQVCYRIGPRRKKECKEFKTSESSLKCTPCTQGHVIVLFYLRRIFCGHCCSPVG